MTPESDILEAIATLTGRSLGDVFYEIEAGNFELLATEALKLFTKNYRLMDRIDDSDPIDDVDLLKKCLEELQAELTIAKDPTKIRELTQDIKSIQDRIQIEY